VNVNGIISTIAGTGEAIYSPDGELARLSPLYGPCGVVVDSNNRLLVVEGSNNKVRRVDLRTGIITTIAGTGEFLFSGDGGPATAATLSFPSGATVDPFGNILILSRGDERLRMISASSGTITTIAGDGVERFSGDGGPAKSASINLTTSSLPFVYNDRQFVTDSAGNIYFPDSGNNRIRKIDRQSGIISTVAGNGVATLGGDGGPATAASLNYPLAVILDAAGNLIIADTLNNRIRKVDTKSGTITTIAGAGPAGLPGAFAGENGPATAASLAIPIALAFDKNQNLYISDRNNGRIRRIDAQTGNIKTVSGGSGGFNGDGGPAANASYRAPTGITFDANGNLFVVDSLNHRIRAIRGPIP
jgi:sugar lactone lactonase YvrE